MTSFHPPQRTLMGPGPSDVHPRILEALSRPTVGHLDPTFQALMAEVKNLLRATFLTKNALTFPTSAPGSAGMEACFVNLLEPGDKVIVCRNGVFGGRMVENAVRCGARAVVVDDPWGDPVDSQKLSDALAAHSDAKVVAFVHAETSTGAQSDAAALCRLARDRGCLTIVDTVTSLGGTPVEVDDWGADAVYSGSQKCLSCVPGIAPVTFSPRAVAAVENRKTKVQSWFLDLSLVIAYWGEGSRSYHHTAPVNAIYALHESLLALSEEGLHAAWARHALNHRALVAGLEAMGLSLPVAPAQRLPQLNAVAVPDRVDEAAVRARLLQDFGIELGAGLGAMAGKIWRIGLMGHSSRRRNVLLCLAALEVVLGDMGAGIVRGEGLAAAEAVYAGVDRVSNVPDYPAVAKEPR